MFSFLVVEVETVEQHIVAQGLEDDLEWVVWAPEEIKVGQEFSVIFDFIPIVTLDVQEITVKVSQFTPKYLGIGILWEESWSSTSMLGSLTYTKIAYLTAEKKGSISGYFVALYRDHHGQEQYSSAIFAITQVRAKTYQELEDDRLTLQKNYDSLETDIINTRMLMYALIVTAGIFLATTIYFAVRKPKTKSS
jgi:hypothetical protein